MVKATRSVFRFDSIRLLRCDEVIGSHRQEELECRTATMTFKTTTNRKKSGADVAHVAKSFELGGDTRDVVARNADTVMSIETALARATLTRVDRRDPYNLFHKLNFEGLQSLTPGFDWNRYLRAVGLNRVGTVNVTEPAFYKELARTWSSLGLDDIKTYLRWHVTRALSPHLSSAFVDENFNFYSRTLRGFRRYGRAGSAALRSFMINWAKRWDRNSSSARLGPS